MSPERVVQNAGRLLPDRVEDRLRSAFNRLAGLVLVGLAVALWASLLTWSADDPSFNRLAQGTARNILGPFGAAASDMMLQSFGLMAVVAALSPAFWGVELVMRERIGRWRRKLLLWLVAVPCLAGALASLPTVAAWPIPYGFGGIFGDIAYSAGVRLLSEVAFGHVWIATALVLLAIGLWALLGSIGCGREELDLLLGGRGRASPLKDARSREPSGLFGWLRQMGSGSRQGREPRVAPAAGTIGEIEAGPEERGEWPAERVEPTLGEREMAERFAHNAPARPHTPARQARQMLDGLRGAAPAAPTYRRPSLNMLKRPVPQKLGPEATPSAMRGVARLLEDVLVDFGIKGQIQDIKPGPVVTLYELEPARGIKASRIVSLSDDIARSMSATSARVAVVPGRNVIGIELPNVRREKVLLREMLESEAYRSAGATLPLALGKSINGNPVVADLARMPHLLIAGTTGSGKSVGINAMILSLLYRLGPEDCRFLMIDPKMLELSVYNGIPHLLTPVITDPMQAVAALNWVVGEMEERYKRMAQLSVRSIDVYNARARNATKARQSVVRTVQTGFDPRTGQPVYEKQEVALTPMPYIVVIVDEMADLMLTAGKDIEGAVQRLAQMARAAGIHLIMATQRPSVDVITGTIKANFPARISFKVASKIDSRTILNEQGAEQLLGHGDLLFSPGGGQVQRVHGPFVADEEVEQVATYLRSLGEPNYVMGILEPKPGSEDDFDDESVGDESDELYDKAVALVLRDRKASTSYIQRRLSIGYNRAADLMERLERDGLVSPANSVGKRDILVGPPGDRPGA
jgi:S-DNA-T family DNA segregation ATPase FtsK/SpoIIIE